MHQNSIVNLEAFFCFIILSMASHGFFNPIPAGVLENQDTLGGGQFDPPL